MAYISFLIFFSSLAALALLIYVTLRPSPLKPLILLAIDAPTYELDERHVMSRDSDHVLYGREGNESVLVFLIGGAFLFNDFSSHYGTSNLLAELLSTRRVDLLMLRYPVRFEHTVHDAMISLNAQLRKHALRYKRCHMMGFSAGALLGGMFARKERSRALADLIEVPQIGLAVTSYVGVCGLYDTRFDNALVTRLFDFYIMRGTPAGERYHCRELGVPVYLISSEYDALVSQTQSYVETQPCTYKMFSERLPHAFVQCVNLPQAREALSLVVEFIARNEENRNA